jgi:hypothetical protein
MQHFEDIINVYMHEIGMHIDHNIDDFKPPFLTHLGDETQVDLGTAAHVDALTACLTSIHEAFNSFVSLDYSVIRCLPTIHFARISYASVALIKLASAATSPASRLGHVFKPTDFMVEYHLNRVIHHMKVAGESDGGRTPAKFSLVLGMLKSWSLKRKDGPPQVDEGIAGLFRSTESGDNIEAPTERALPSPESDSLQKQVRTHMNPCRRSYIRSQ